ncbi:MAG: hypothetical protein ACRDZ4_23235 [Egibacteraceae bacterium]
MDAVIDSSTLISLAWSGLMTLLGDAPLELAVPDVVYRETVVEGLAHGHPDAAAIEAAVSGLPTLAIREANTADEAVLDAAVKVGALLTNDVGLGRRAANLGVRWLRTADLVVLCVRASRLDAQEGLSALEALYSAGRISEDLLIDYRKEVS